MKLLVVADFMFPEVVGGSATMAYEISRELAARGHDIAVLTRQLKNDSRAAPQPDWPVHRYRVPASQFLYPLAVLRAMAVIRKLVTRESYDLVVMHHACTSTAVELLKGFSSAFPPTIFFFHGPWHKEAFLKEQVVEFSEHTSSVVDVAGDNKKFSMRHRVRRAADRFVLRTCTSVVVMSKYTTGEACNICDDVPRKIFQISGGVDVQRFKPPDDRSRVRRRLGVPEEKIVMLTVRRLSPRMGLENLVRAMAIIEEARPDTMLLIGGKGPLRDHLSGLIVSLDLQRTHLIGYIPDELLHHYYQASDLFVMPSIALEGFGLGTIEAMACGVPVVGTPTGATVEILNQVSPEFVLSGIDPAQIAKGIIGRLPDLQNPDLRQKVRRFSEGCSWKHVTDRLENHFQEVVSPRP